MTKSFLAQLFLFVLLLRPVVAFPTQTLDNKTSIEADQSFLSHKEKNENTSVFSCLKRRLTLRKNMVNGVNTLVSEMFPYENTTYVIKYDFVNTGDIFIPDNCSLYFKGGSIRGGRITGRNTRIKYKSIIFDNVEIEGSWIVPVIHANMFAEMGADNFLPKMFKLCNKNIENTLVIDEGIYNIHTRRDGYSIPILESNTTLDIQGTINIDSDNRDGGIGFICTGSNIHIKGNGKIVGDREKNTSNTEWSPVFFCNNCDNLFFEGITIQDSYGDGIYCRYNCNNVTIKGITFRRNRRCAIAFNSGKNHTISQCVFIENGGRAPGCAIEFESDGQDMDIPIINNYIVDNYFRQNDRDIVLGAGNTYTETVIVKGNKSEYPVSSFLSVPDMKSDYVIKNVSIENNTVIGCSMFLSGCFKNRTIISGNNINTGSTDYKTPCLNIKGNVLLENNTIFCPNRPAFENTYAGIYKSKFDLVNNEITSHNSILQLYDSKIEGNTFNMNHLILYLYDNSECKENVINGTLTSGTLLYLGLSDSDFKSNKVDLNNTPNHGVKLVRKEGHSNMDNNTFKNALTRDVILDSSNK